MLIRSCIFTSLITLTGCTAPDAYYQALTDKDYGDVLAEAEVAITGHNFRITGHNRIGKTIRERRGKNFPDFDTIQFCNLNLAESLLDIAPDAIVNMPCTLYIYPLNGKTAIKTHLLPEESKNPALREFAIKMNTQLKEIVDFTAKPDNLQLQPIKTDQP